MKDWDSRSSHALMKDEFIFSLILVILMRFPDDSFPAKHHNIYGIKVQNGHRSKKVVIKPTSWIRRHRINPHSLSFAKIQSFERRMLGVCDDPKNVQVVKVKRIGGGYPYGPKNGTLSNNRICKIERNLNPTIELLMNELIKDIKRNIKAKQLRRSAIWCSYCRAYWKRRLNHKKLAKCCAE